MWSAPDEEDLKLSLSELELEEYAEAASRKPGTETTAGMLARGANYVRGFLRANPTITLGPAGTIPASLVAPLMDYLCVDAIKRIPLTVSDERREARKQAIQTFRDASKGVFLVESYGADDDASNAGHAALASSSEPRFTPEQLKGL